MSKVSTSSLPGKSLSSVRSGGYHTKPGSSTLYNSAGRPVYSSLYSSKPMTVGSAGVIRR